MSKNLICVDLGNTTIHFGSFAKNEIVLERSIGSAIAHRQPSEITKLIEEITASEELTQRFRRGNL
jgi:pantothenate kinase type III